MAGKYNIQYRKNCINQSCKPERGGEPGFENHKSVQRKYVKQSPKNKTTHVKCVSSYIERWQYLQVCKTKEEWAQKNGIEGVNGRVINKPACSDDKDIQESGNGIP